MDQGRQHNAYAMVNLKNAIKSKALHPGSSAQKAEIIALARAVLLTEGKWVNIYINSRSAFSVVHAHRAIWKERGLFTSNNKDIKHNSEILSLLEVLYKPSQVATMHFPGHQKGEIHKRQFVVNWLSCGEGSKGRQLSSHFLRRLTCHNISQCIQKRTRRVPKSGDSFLTTPRLAGWKYSAQGIVLIHEALLDTTAAHSW